MLPFERWESNAIKNKLCTYLRVAINKDIKNDWSITYVVQLRILVVLQKNFSLGKMHCSALKGRGRVGVVQTQIGLPIRRENFVTKMYPKDPKVWFTKVVNVFEIHEMSDDIEDCKFSVFLP